MKLKTIFPILLPLLVLGAIIAVYYIKQPQSIKNRKVDYQMSSLALNKEFLRNDSIANKKYSDKVIELSGSIANVRKSDAHGLIITLDDVMMGIKCVMDTTVKSLPVGAEIGSSVVIKGVCIGFDPLVGLMINQCIINKIKAPANL